MPLHGRGVGPQGLKPAFLAEPSGTAEAVPSPEPIYETSARSFSFGCAQGQDDIAMTM